MAKKYTKTLKIQTLKRLKGTIDSVLRIYPISAVRKKRLAETEYLISLVEQDLNS